MNRFFFFVWPQYTQYSFVLCVRILWRNAVFCFFFSFYNWHSSMIWHRELVNLWHFFLLLRSHLMILFKYLLCCLPQHWMTPKKPHLFRANFINYSFRSEIANNMSFEHLFAANAAPNVLSFVSIFLTLFTIIDKFDRLIVKLKHFFFSLVLKSK